MVVMQVPAVVGMVAGLGGSSASSYPNGGAGGGGASDIRLSGTNLTNRIIVAGGGSGTGANNDPYGIAGVGGGTAGGSPPYQSGGGHVPLASGATQTAGGTAGGYCSGFYGTNGSLGQGRTRWRSEVFLMLVVAGGGGYYGGGGGGASYGGGGGSGYIGSLANAQTLVGNTAIPNPSGGTMVGNTGNGYAKITLVN